MRVKVGGQDFDLRVSFLPTVHGEKCVLRILDKSNLSASMDKLGLDQDTYRRFRAAVDAPHGLIACDRSDRFRQNDHALFRAE